MGGNLVTNSQQEGTMTNGVMTKNNRTKIIKRYQNRKLYDTQQSCYVTLDDIAKMIRATEEVMVIDNKTKNDITAATLTQIIFEAEKKSAQYAPLSTLREIIQYGNGSISSYLAKLGAFTAPEKVEQPAPEPQPVMETKTSTDDMKQALENRIANAAASLKEPSAPHQKINYDDDDITPDLPNSNKAFE